jgi:E3 ubiquitin-protein ligase BOI and related proteins
LFFRPQQLCSLLSDKPTSVLTFKSIRLTPACMQNERLRAGLEEARRRHVQAVVSAVERAATWRLLAAEADLERALARNAELGDKVHQMGAEGHTWQGVASGHEAVPAGLRATIEQLLPTLCAGAGARAADEGQGEVEDTRSCCF